MKANYFKTVDAKKTSDTTIEISRSFKAKKEEVYKAFTKPDLIKRWMGKMPGWEMTACDMEVREGGKYKWRWKNEAEKMEFGFHGVFRQIVANQMMVQTQVFDPGTMGGDMGKECLITQSFTEGDGFTTVVTHIKYQSASDMEMATSTGMTDGMEISYSNLDKELKN